MIILCNMYTLAMKKIIQPYMFQNNSFYSNFAVCFVHRIIVIVSCTCKLCKHICTLECVVYFQEDESKCCRILLTEFVGYIVEFVEFETVDSFI